ncbi:hypothetical protein KW850_32405 [Bacillus sp. sid0103]|uniref:hypothetical protein n=1 Tax=Bacillus sp. sid0103 TaxID=2856337 RepID=UPI001C440A25|nr:hypothetical protein [Bacillus sp. sid0103]MBV7509782.1 hypothetical protein [Bacillus sp. sid0103]
MSYEIIQVNEYYGNNFSGSRLAKLYSNGRLEYLPEPDPPEENEEEQLCTRS